MAKAKSKSRDIHLRFPVLGLNERPAYGHQKQYSTQDSKNVIPDDSYAERERGGSRPGLEKEMATQLGSGNIVNLVYDVHYISSGEYATQLVAASNGTLYYNSTGTTMAAASGTPSTAMDTGRQLCACDHLQKLYIASDNNAAQRLVEYDPATNTSRLVTGNETAGTVPDNCRICVTYQDCVWLAHDTDDPHMWHKSAQGDALNWDVAASGVARATNGTNSQAGKLGEPITAMIPHMDDCMFMSGTTSLYVMRGNVNQGGIIKRLSDNIGVLSQQAWCHDTEGWLWMLTHDGLYAMPPGCGATPISVSREKLPTRLRNLDTATYWVSLAYDVTFRGIWIAVTQESSAGGEWYWVDTFTEFTADGGHPKARASFWELEYTGNHQPGFLYQRRDARSADSTVVFGGRDGYLRIHAADQANDDGTNFTTYLEYGPFQVGRGMGLQDGMLSKITAVLDNNSSAMKWTAYSGKTPQDAIDQSAAGEQRTGNWDTAGLNPWDHCRLRGPWIVLKVEPKTAGTRIAWEEIYCIAEELGWRRFGL